VGERDISEKIALGLAKPTIGKDSMFDQRLFNQTSGMSQGFAANDAYDIYDKPLFQSAVSNIYKPTRERDDAAGVDTKQFDSLLANKGPHKGFSGTDATAAGASSGPVVFEKEDVFGVDAFMNAAKRGRDDNAEDSQTKKGKY
jgi:SNW domain-containing protein 1